MESWEEDEFSYAIYNWSVLYFLPKNKGGIFRKKQIYEAYQSNLRKSRYVSLKSRF